MIRMEYEGRRQRGRRRRRRMNSMDLNLYLGLPLSQLPRTPDLGSDLALGSSSSSDLPIGESQPGTVTDMPTFRDPSDGNQVTYSPSNPESAAVDDFVTDLDFQPVTDIDGDLGRHRAVDNPLILGRVEPWFDRDGGSSSRHDDPLTQATYRFGTLIHSHLPVRDRSIASRRFRASLPYIGEQSSNVSSLQVAAATTVYAGDSTEKSGKNKKNDNGVDKEGLAEESEDQSGAIASVNFECNICFELANEPVVTSCGHLFCWPCLYLWLHQYSDHKECPACKGQVNESNIIPIYGRGCSSELKNAEKDSDSENLRIPQKPHGHRIESTRQQRAALRRSAVVEGVFDPFRHILSDMSQLEGLLDPSLSHFTGRSDHQLQQQHDQPNGSGQQERMLESSAMQQLIDRRRVMTRLRARRLLRLSESQEIPSNPSPPVSTAAIGVSSRVPTSLSVLSSLPQVTNTMMSSDPHIHYSSGMSASERLTAVHSDLMRLVSRFARNSVPSSFTSEAVPAVIGRNNQTNSHMTLNAQLSSGGGIGGGTHSTSTNTTTDQASASSSTMAIIQGDSPPASAAAVAAAIGTSVEPNIAGTSRSTSSRRRGRSTAPCLPDNSGSIHDNKRRRPN